MEYYKSMIKYIAIAPVPEKNTEDYSLPYDSDVADLFKKFPVIDLHSMNDHRLSMSLKFQETETRTSQRNSESFQRMSMFTLSITLNTGRRLHKEQIWNTNAKIYRSEFFFLTLCL